MHSHLRCRVGMLAAGSLILAGLGASGAVAAAPSTASVVTGHSAWYPQAYENFTSGTYLTPQQQDVAGPQRAPYGTSSHKITIGESTAQTELYRTNAYDGVKVSDLTRLEYSTMTRRVAGTGGDRQPAYLRLSVDADGTDDAHAIDQTLYFFPANNSDQNPAANGVWQSWDVSGGEIDVDGDNGGTTTLADYAASHADAVLVNAPFDESHDAGAISLITGGQMGGDGDSQTNGEYFVDRVIVGQNDQDTLFDFGGNDETNGGTTNEIVDPANDQGWKHQAYGDVDYYDSTQKFVDGPETSPAGGGSLKFTLDSVEKADRVELFRTTQYDDTLLRDLRTMEFNTFQRGDTGNATPQQPAYLRLSVDNDGVAGTDDTLFYFPANNGAVEQSTWQDWNAATGLWNVGSDTGVAGAVSLEDYVVANPDAMIVENGDAGFPDQPKGGVAFMVGAAGENQMNGEFFLDDITIGKVDAANGATDASKQFDLEPTAPTLAIGNASVSEGNSGATLKLPVILSRKVTRAVTVDYATSNGTARSGSDYRTKAGTVTIPAGSTSGVVSVVVLSDKVREANETQRVTLSSPSNATVSDGSGLGTIVNDDTKVGLNITKATRHRVRAAVVTASGASGAPVKVYRVTRSGSVRVLSSRLNASGRTSVVLGRHYRRGANVTMFATVSTANGLYTSPRDRVTFRR
jgi:hypothetical protein